MLMYAAIDFRIPKKNDFPLLWVFAVAYGDGFIKKIHNMY